MVIVTASNRPEVLKENLCVSTFLEGNEFLLGMGEMNNFNIPKIYNAVPIDQDENIVMYVHDDVIIRHEFKSNLDKALQELPEDWGIIGSAGVRMENGIKKNIGHILDRGKNWGSPINKIEPVQTLDELLIILNRKNIQANNIKFDEQFPFDFYAADLCMQAKDHGLGVYVFPGAYVNHNSSRKFGERTESFYESEAKFKAKWNWVEGHIVTTCSIIK